MWTLKHPRATHPLIWMRSRTSIRWGEVNMPVRRPQERRIRSVKAQVEPCGVGQLSSGCGRCSRRTELNARALPLVPAMWMTLTLARASPRESLCRESPPVSAHATAHRVWRHKRHMPPRATHVHPDRKVGERRRRVLALWAVVCPHKSLQARDGGIVISLWHRAHLPRNTAGTESAMGGSTATVAKTANASARPRHGDCPTHAARVQEPAKHWQLNVEKRQF